MHQPLYINDADDINITEDTEEDLETPTGENISPTAKVGKFLYVLVYYCITLHYFQDNNLLHNVTLLLIVFFFFLH